MTASPVPDAPVDTPPEDVRLRGLPWLVGHNALNAVFAYLTVFGPVFLLFLDELGLPKAQIGLLLSLLPFSGLLALGSAPVATRLGRKRVFVTCWGSRKIVAAGLLLLPWVLARWGHAGSLVYLVVVIAIFAVLRAVAETVWYPWLQEVVPDRVRGRFGATSTLVTTLVSCLTLAAAGQALKGHHGLHVFLVLIAAGCVFGVLSVLAMLPVPGGQPQPQRDPGDQHLTNMRGALRDRNFVLYLAGLGSVTVGTLLYLSFLPLFLKQALGLPSGVVVTLEALIMVGGAVSALLWGFAADRVGSRPVLMSAAAMTLLIPLGWLLLPRQAPHLVVWCAALYLVHGMALNGAALGAGRLLLNDVVPVRQNTAYTALYYAWIGLVGGVAPLLAGALLQTGGGWHVPLGWLTVDAHAVLFALAAVLIAVGWACYGRVRPDDRYRTRDVLYALSTRILRRLPWRGPL